MEREAEEKKRRGRSIFVEINVSTIDRPWNDMRILKCLKAAGRQGFLFEQQRKKKKKKFNRMREQRGLEGE